MSGPPEVHIWRVHGEVDTTTPPPPIPQPFDATDDEADEIGAVVVLHGVNLWVGTSFVTWTAGDVLTGPHAVAAARHGLLGRQCESGRPVRLTADVEARTGAPLHVAVLAGAGFTVTDPLSAAVVRRHAPATSWETI